MAKTPTVLRMAVPSPLYRLFDYLPPEGCNPKDLQPGVRLRLPFGRAQVVGILIEVSNKPEIEHHKLKPALALLDNYPLLSNELMGLLRWASNYYHRPLGDALASALPTLLRQGEAAEAKHRSLWRITESGQLIDPDSISKRAKRQADLLHRLQQQPQGLTADQFTDLPRSWTDAMAALVKNGWVTIEQIPSLSRGEAHNVTLPTLNTEQQTAVQTTIKQLNQFIAILLDGVTGSGKTEVYLRVITEVLAAGKQALILVPEITLTPQLIERFKQRFDVPIAVLHSGLNDRERLNGWLYGRSGEAAIIIGTRSAVFTPLKNPGIIIIDEEHDPSFKQQSGFRYSARDLALVRAQRLNIPIMLGSATPSFESLLNSQQQRYQHLRLPQRAGDAKPPSIELLDVRNQAMEEQISAPLIKRMKKHLTAGGQVLLFLNRRGFAPTLICHECGWIADCRRCDANMTLHQARHHLRCHHCGSQRPITQQCPGCGSADLRPIGSGTERIEDALVKHFPEHNISRIDRDATRRKGSMEAILNSVHQGKSQILIGTQMLAKGHHFPNVTLVGILDGDQGLFGIDFRASERMSQLIIQVAGRAGRAEKTGEVVIQTHHPDNPLLLRLCHEGYHAFAKAAMAERQLAALPPYTHMAVIRAEANQQQLPMDFLDQAQQQANHFAAKEVEIYGPLPAPMERRAGKYRAQLLLQCEQRSTLHQCLKQLVPCLNELPSARKVRWSLEVDPVDLI
jgi:primosomal protein N' (replication factor Y)